MLVREENVVDGLLRFVTGVVFCGTVGVSNEARKIYGSRRTWEQEGTRKLALRP